MTLRSGNFAVCPRCREIGGWLLSVCAEFTSFAAIGVALALPMLAAGVFGPADGWRRVCVLVFVVAFVALPLAALVRRIANAMAWLQQGRIANYLLYSFVTLVVLLALVL